jgi:dethiobiotin synthetase
MSAALTWFVTGTDTNAGKTTVCKALLLAARARGLRATGYKPIESGCPPKQEFGSDARALAEAAGSAPQCSYVFEAPVAPLHAAEQEGQTISTAAITAKARALRDETDLLLMEGAGGLLVPISSNSTIADLAIALAQPLLIVAPDTLGSINHSLLTIEGARQRGLQVDALVLCERDSGAGQGLANASQIRNYGKIEVLHLGHSRTLEELGLAGETLLEALLAIRSADNPN